MALMHIDFFSSVLGMCMQMDVILPQKATGQIGIASREGGDRIPVLYLLHGMSDDHTIWQRRTSIERYAAEYNLAVVMPSVHLSWYTDMAHGYRYQTYLCEELPKIVSSFFRGISTRREDTFIAGLSMGGYGALKAALTYPERYAVAASLSGALDVVQFGESRGSYWSDIFGPTEELPGSRHDLSALAEKNKTAGKPMPPLFLWCGTEDRLLSHSRTVRDRLSSLGYAVTYSESAGDHNWACWDEQIQRVLRWLPLPENASADGQISF